MSTVGIGVYGAGWVAGEHIRSYGKNPHACVVAIGSRTQESAQARADEAGLMDCAIYTDLDSLLADPRVDAVSLCTPPNAHPEETVRCAQAGKHILIEKAVANDPAGLKAMTDAVRAAGVKTVVSFVLRWNPQFQWINRMLDEGLLGPLFMAEVDYWHNIGPQYKQYAWNVRKEIAGSALLSAGCHAVDALRQFVRSEVVEVTAYSNKRNPEYEYDTNLIGILRFENGVLGKVSTSFDVQCPYQFNIDLLGEKGTIRDNRIYAQEFFPGQTDWVTIPTVRPDSGDVKFHPFDGEIDHFIACVRNNRDSFVDLFDAGRTHEVCFALDKSAAEGRPVKLQEIQGNWSIS